MVEEGGLRVWVFVRGGCNVVGKKQGACRKRVVVCAKVVEGVIIDVLVEVC